MDQNIIVQAYNSFTFFGLRAAIAILLLVIAAKKEPGKKRFLHLSIVGFSRNDFVGTPGKQPVCDAAHAAIDRMIPESPREPHVMCASVPTGRVVPEAVVADRFARNSGQQTNAIGAFLHAWRRYASGRTRLDLRRSLLDVPPARDPELRPRTRTTGSRDRRRGEPSTEVPPRQRRSAPAGTPPEGTSVTRMLRHLLRQAQSRR